MHLLMLNYPKVFLRSVGNVIYEDHRDTWLLNNSFGIDRVDNELLARLNTKPPFYVFKDPLQTWLYWPNPIPERFLPKGEAKKEGK